MSLRSIPRVTKPQATALRVAAFSAAVLAVAAGCTSTAHHESEPTQPATRVTPSRIASEPAAPAALHLPPIDPAEIGRLRYISQPARSVYVVGNKPHLGQFYVVEAACLSTPAGKVVRYELLNANPHSGKAIGGHDLTCDGHVDHDELSLPVAPIQVAWQSDMTGVSSGYVVIKP